MKRTDVLRVLLSIKEGKVDVVDDTITFSNLVSKEGRLLQIVSAPKQLIVSIRSEKYYLNYESLVEVYVFFSNPENTLRELSITTKFASMDIHIRKDNFIDESVGVLVDDSNLDCDDRNN